MEALLICSGVGGVAPYPGPPISYYVTHGFVGVELLFLLIPIVLIAGILNRKRIAGTASLGTSCITLSEEGAMQWNRDVLLLDQSPLQRNGEASDSLPFSNYNSSAIIKGSLVIFVLFVLAGMTGLF